MFEGLFGPRRDVDSEVAVLLPEPLRTEAYDLVRQGHRVKAVKVVRERTGLNMLPAVRAVDLLAKDDAGF